MYQGKPDMLTRETLVLAFYCTYGVYLLHYHDFSVSQLHRLKQYGYMNQSNCQLTRIVLEFV